MSSKDTNKVHLPADLSLQDRIKRDLAVAAQQVETAPVDRIRMSGKGFALPDGTAGATITGVIVDFVSANLYYADDYDSDNPAPPSCYAVGRIPGNLAPSTTSPDPQAETCGACPHNKFESGRGRGKRCKNTRQVAFMPLDATEDSPIYVLSVPPKSIRFFDTYVKTTLRGRYQLPPIAVVTELHMDPKSDFAAPRFKYVRNLNEAELAAYYARKPEAEALLLQRSEDGSA